MPSLTAATEETRERWPSAMAYTAPLSRAEDTFNPVEILFWISPSSLFVEESDCSAMDAP